MNPKIKILLHSIMRDVSRGITTPEQAAASFKKSTGQELDEVLDQADPKVGEFLAFLVGAYKIPETQEPEVDLAALPEDPETNLTAQELAAMVQPPVEAPADPETEAETPADPEAEKAQQEPKSDAPAVPVHQPKRTRQSAKKSA